MESYSMDEVSDYSSDDSSSEGLDNNDSMKEIDISSNGLVIEASAFDFYNKEFETEEDAYDLYVRYAKCVGFGVRKGDVKRDNEGNLRRRTFFCSNEGKRHHSHYERDDRKKDPKPETRVNCRARLIICRENQNSNWKVHSLEEGHNHDLIERKFVHLIPNHRKITETDKAMINSMHGYGMQTSQIMGFMAGQAGGYGRVGFSRKDLYNYIDRRRRAKISDGDAAAAISYLEGKADADGMTVARYTSTDNDCLGNLFWADGLSRVDYQYFGDVLAFDATYKKNKYNKPLVILSGANHHMQICIFGFALLGDERTETYQWLLEQFLDVMRNKQPNVVVTDGDDAMREAIRRVFPEATHRLCAWHLQKNATSNIKDEEFCATFKKFIYSNYDCDQFERHWHETMERLDLSENRWVKSAYERRGMWAYAYLRDKFCAGIRTTSRCEGINSFIKRFIKSKYSIFELVQSLERVVKEYRNNELVAQFNSLYSQPVLTTGLNYIEDHAAKVYTRAIYKEVRKEMEKVASFVYVAHESIATTIKYKMCKYGEPNKTYEVLYHKNGDKNDGNYECKCYFWNSNGIPCCHIFFVMKYEHIIELPQSLIMKRWCKDAKSYEEEKEEEDTERTQLLRYGALCSSSMWMSFLGSKTSPNFRKTMEGIVSITNELEKTSISGEKVSEALDGKKIGDPAIAKTKGAPRGRKSESKRRCSNCSLGGHTKRNCPEVISKKSLKNDDNIVDGSEFVDGNAHDNGASSTEMPTETQEFTMLQGNPHSTLGCPSWMIGGHMYPGQQQTNDLGHQWLLQNFIDNQMNKGGPT